MIQLQKKAEKLFTKFNETHFEGKLCNIKVELSGKMKNTAGAFIPRIKKIRINKRLLSFRGERELIETLLVRKQTKKLKISFNLKINKYFSMK
jgi:DNA-binding protein YbaB